jgi:hypothetical protein
LSDHRYLRATLVVVGLPLVLIGAFSRFIASELGEGNAVITLVTEAHDRSLRHSLQASHVDLALAIRQQRYVSLNISELLAKVMVNGHPDPIRFLKAAEDVVTDAARRATSQHAKVAACGECSGTVWAQEHLEAAIQLEQLWDDIAKSRQMDILCAYPLAVRDESVPAVRRLCAEHTAVEIS